MRNARKKMFLEDYEILYFFLESKNVGYMLLKILLLFILFEANAFFWGFLYDHFLVLTRFIYVIAFWILLVGVVNLAIAIWAIVRMIKKAK